MSIFDLCDWDYFFYGEISGKKQIHRGGKLKERLNQKCPEIKSEDFPFFSIYYRMSLIRLGSYLE